MKTYIVRIRETLCKDVEVQADNEEQAEETAKWKYGDYELELDRNDDYESFTATALCLA